ncbi:hypothetical protein [Actinophytocola xinjiangensis]|nr:hypothetical protein [Actinophytocola xinjiangensis]
MPSVDDQSTPDEESEHGDSPVLVELGVVRTVVLGNSSSGNSDANTQYYW